MGFTGFMRTDQLLHLQVRDIVFKDTYMQLNIRRLKTDQMQNGALVHIAKLESPLCPFTFTKTYIAEMGLHDRLSHISIQIDEKRT